RADGQPETGQPAALRLSRRHAHGGYSMISAMTLLVLRCGDLAAAKRFYEALGLSFRAEKHGAGPEHHSCRIGATGLELYPARMHARAAGRVRLGLRVDAVEQAYRSGRAAGGRPSNPPRQNLLEDPDGNQVELVAGAQGLRLAAAGNVVVPAIVLLEEQGWRV